MNWNSQQTNLITGLIAEKNPQSKDNPPSNGEKQIKTEILLNFYKLLCYKKQLASPYLSCYWNV